MAAQSEVFCYSRTFLDAYQELPATIQKKVDKQLRRLSENQTHPSLRTRKMTDMHGIWEARIDKRYRLTFERNDGIIQLRNVGRHDIYSRT